MADTFITLTKAILFLPPSPLKKQRRIAPRNRVRHYMSVFHIGNQPFFTDSCNKLDIYVDTQELLNASHHSICFEYDEDTVSLVVDPTLSTLDILISNNSDLSTGNASAFEYECYEVKDDTPQFNYHEPKIKIPKHKSPLTICTADTINTIRSQRLF
jgi:hypothetical protein